MMNNRKSGHDLGQPVDLHQVGVDTVVLELDSLPPLHPQHLPGDRHEVAVRRPHLLHPSEGPDHGRQFLRNFFPFFNNIIDKAVLGCPPSLSLLALDLAADGGELALALLVALGQLGTQVGGQEVAEFLKMVGTLERVIEGVHLERIYHQLLHPEEQKQPLLVSRPKDVGPLEGDVFLFYSPIRLLNLWIVSLMGLLD